MDVVKTVRNSDVPRRWNAIIEAVAEDKKIIVVERRGTPTVAFVPFEVFEEIQEMKRIQPGKGENKPG